MNISFITLTKDRTKFEALKRNLNLIIKAADDIHLFEVNGEKYDIPSGYNLGVQETRDIDSDDAIFIFLHDDAKLLCNREIFDSMIELASIPETGVVGVAGSTSLSRSGCWWQDTATCRGSVFHPNEQTVMHQNCWPGPGHALYGNVLVLDGLLLCCKASVFKKLGGFNVANPGFHFYDIDFSFRAHLQGYKNYVVPLPIFHGSIGELSQNWEDARVRFVNNYSSCLPRSI